MIMVYTDGSCLGNPGLGGYSYIIMYENEILIQKGIPSITQTTNNKMELQAVITVLDTLYKSGIYDKIVINTDSTYVIKGITEWINGWIKRNFRDVKNAEQWKQLYELNSNMCVDYQWVKGHNKHYHNELADALAVKAAKQQIEITGV